MITGDASGAFDGAGIDPARAVLPGFDRLVGWLADAIRWPTPIRLQGVRLQRFWPSRRGRISFELAIDLSSDGVETTCFLQGGRLGGIKTGTVRGDTVMATPWVMNLCLSNRESGWGVVSPDRDPRLPGLGDALLTDRAIALFRGSRAGSVLGLDQGETAIRSDLIAYRINKRAVVRLSGAAGVSVYLKAYRRMPPVEEIDRYQRLRSLLDERSGGRLGMPAILDTLPDNRCLVMSAVEGDCRPLGQSSEDIAAAAEALAVFHGLDIDTGRNHSPRDELRIAGRWLKVLRGAAPALHGRMRSIVLALARLAKSIPMEGLRLVHRDFYGAQILLQGDRVRLVDFDTLGKAHPEVDVSTFVAHLLLDAMIAGKEDSSALVSASAFLEAYRRGHHLDPRRLRFYLPSALVRLGAIHWVRGLPVEQVSRLWGIAESAVAGGLPTG